MSYNKADKRDNRRNEPEFNIETERAAFLAHVSSPLMKAEYAKLLGPDIDVDRFISTAIDTVQQKPDMLNPAFRNSLFWALKKAAKQGLKPDGKEGALVPRWNNDARMKVVEWQPMIWGVIKAGRRAGALKKLTVELVFAGEPFRFLRGDEERIEHEWLPDVRSKAYSLLRKAPTDGYDQDGEQPGINFEGFWDQVVAAYCIITAPDGTKTRRAMPRERLLNLRDFSRARAGPWFSVFLDEMILKATALFTMKHVETDAADDRAKAFRDALEQDLDIDLSDGDEESHRTIDHVPTHPAHTATSAPALPAPSAMDVLAAKLTAQVTGNGPQSEKVPVGGEPPQDQSEQQRAPQEPDPPSDPPSDPSPEPPPQSEDPEPPQQPAKKPGPTDAERQKKAEEFTRDVLRGVRDALASSGEDLETVFGNAAVTRSLSRLGPTYPALYDKIVSALAAAPGKIGVLQQVNPTLYDRVTDELAKRAAA